MPLPDAPPLDREPVSAAVHARLRAAILAGDLAPGEALPAERALAERFGVNRHAVREALKRLQQAAPGPRRPGRRDARARLAPPRRDRAAARRRHGAPARTTPSCRAILEFRAALGADVARRCAERGAAGAVAAARALAPRSLDARRPAEERAARYEELWQAVVDGAGNLGYRLAYNTLLDGQHLVAPAVARVAPEMDDAATLDAVLHALSTRDGEAAHAAARRLLEPAAAP